MSELIIVVSSARAGSTNLRRVLQSFDAVETFGEAFNPTGGMDQDRIRLVGEFMGTDPTDIDKARAEMREWMRRDPVRACRKFLEYSDSHGGRFVEFKALPGHLSAPHFEAVLREFRPIGIFLYRTPIDVFISLEKAKTLGRYRRVDTTDVKPEISARGFMTWKFKQQNHYQMAAYLFRKSGLRTLPISYEDMYADTRSPCAYVQDRMKEVGVDLGSYVEDGSQMMNRQDRTSERAQKVANWDAFHAEAMKHMPEVRTGDLRLRRQHAGAEGAVRDGVADLGKDEAAARVDGDGAAGRAARRPGGADLSGRPDETSPRDGPEETGLTGLERARSLRKNAIESGRARRCAEPSRNGMTNLECLRRTARMEAT